MKNTKVGQGLKFLPRKLNDLLKSLQVLLVELAETGKTVRNKVSAVLEDVILDVILLVERSLYRYTAIKEDNILQML